MTNARLRSGKSLKFYTNINDIGDSRESQTEASPIF